MTDIGFDWLLIDAEHAPFNPESLASILMAFDSRPTVSIVRVPWDAKRAQTIRNRLAARSVNAFGVQRPESWMTVELYQIGE